MKGTTREKIYESEHDAVSDFIERKSRRWVAVAGRSTPTPGG
jgi:hypothetical protein